MDAAKLKKVKLWVLLLAGICLTAIGPECLSAGGAAEISRRYNRRNGAPFTVARSGRSAGRDAASPASLRDAAIWDDVVPVISSPANIRRPFGTLNNSVTVNASAWSINSQTEANNCLKCHAQATGRAAEVVKLHAASTHGQQAVRCQDCHGGDAAQSDKSKAHAGSFVAKPDASATLQMCGPCHQAQLAQFKTSRHFPVKRGIPRLDCAECHGAHSIGNPPESFTFAQFCTGCHGLEYLPALPQSFQDLLTLTDEVRDELRQRAAQGRPLSGEINKQRRELRRHIAEIVHPTDLPGGLTRIPQLLPLGAKLKQKLKTSP